MPSRSLLAGLITVTTALAGPTQAQPCSPTEAAKFVHTDGETTDEFGRSVSVSGDAAVIGVWRDRDANTGVRYGSAFIARFDGANWAAEAFLLAADGASNDRFGLSVAISGDTAVIGASGDDDNGTDSGSAYVFRFDGANWAQEAKLLPIDGAAGDEFGRSVSISESAVVIGANGDDDNGNVSGSAYVFRFDGANWVQEAKLLPADGAATDRFGRSVSVSGDTAVIGAYLDNDNGTDSGSAYVFRYDGTNWAEEAKLLPTDGALRDWFGYSVSVSGNAAVIGAYQDDDNGNESGSAYVFRFDGTGWTEEAKLLATDGAGLDEFGRSVSISGETTLIGADGDDDNGSRSGSAHVYRFDGTGWATEGKLHPADGTAGDGFGRSVSVSGEVAVIGAHLNDDSGGNSGSAYVFDLNCMTICLPDTNGDGVLTPTDFTAWINAFNNNLPECDQNGDGACTPTDFTAWIANFNAGC